MGKKKVLIVTYYWPPAGGPGVQRWLKFVKYLPEFDIEPIVYVPENPSYPVTDPQLLEEISTGTRVIKYPIFEPYGFAKILAGKKSLKIQKGIIPDKKQSFVEKILLWVRGNFFIPDARKYWVKPSVSFLSNIIAEEKIDTIITSGPPHSLHLIGYGLKQNNKHLKWISDFRDPWTTIGYHSKLKLTKSAAKKHKKLESEVLLNSDLIIVTSHTTKKLFSEITQRPVEIITNGYDFEFKENANTPEKFSLAHIGSLLTGRNPEILWQVLKELIEENKTFANDFKLVLAGVVSKEVLANIYAHNLKANTDILGYISHDEVLALQRKAAVLLLLEINSEDTRCIIPGKLFEYMVSGRPIVAIGPDSWDVFPIIEKTCSGESFTYTEKQKLKEKILSYYLLFKQKKLYTTPQNTERYHRKNLTENLAGLIKKM